MVELFVVERLTRTPRIVGPRFRVSPHEYSPRGRTLNEPELPQTRTPWADLVAVATAPTLSHDGSSYDHSVLIALIPRQDHRIEQRDWTSGIQSQTVYFVEPPSSTDKPL
jgi:hypothetical protein